MHPIQIKTNEKIDIRVCKFKALLDIILIFQADIDEAEAEEDYEFLEQLLQSRELNALVKAHNVILFCNQEQCPCVSNACQITADVMEDIRPYALMVEECRDLYALLSSPHVRVRFVTQCTLVQNEIVSFRNYCDVSKAIKLLHFQPTHFFGIRSGCKISGFSPVLNSREF